MEHKSPLIPHDDIRQLQRYLNELAKTGDDNLSRYELNRPPMPPGFYWQIRWLVSCMLRWLESAHLKKPDPWPVGLKQSRHTARTTPFLVWALGTDRETLRCACRGFSELQRLLPGFTPVLVTDVADFAFFSRLGWMVEFMPALPGAGQAYEVRKAQLIARLYRNARVLPACVGLEVASRSEELRQLILQGIDE